MSLFKKEILQPQEYFDYCTNANVVMPLAPHQPIFLATKERVLGRTILKWSPYCGSYSNGGPCFLGFWLKENETYSEEWLILRIWEAGTWLSVNGRWLEARPDQYAKGRPLYSNYADAWWDDFKPLVTRQRINSFSLSQKAMRLSIGEAVILLEDDLSKRNVLGLDGKPRELKETDDLREAWVIAPFPNVQI